MADNSKESKRRRSSSGSVDEETQEDKRQRPLNRNQGETHALAASTQLVQSINAEWSRTMTTKRRRSQSQSPTSNVRARIKIDLSSSNPEPTKFLMGAMAMELENISQTLSSNTPQSSSVSRPSTPTPTTPLSSPMRSQLQSPSDPYERVAITANQILEKLQQDPFLAKFYARK